LRVLDVGCGDNPKGNVNLDLFFYVKCENFIIADAHHLPFKNSSFEKVFSKHCVEHLENPFEFFEEAKRILANDGILECIYPTDTRLRKKTIHNLINLHWASAFKWKTKLTGGSKINYGGHKWQLPDERVLELLQKAGFSEVDFHRIRFPSIRTDNDPKKIKWKTYLNRYLPTWQIETKFTAKAR
jgi:ubiquinone/menaquinone biosynthesis C-methylase UbiE